MTIPAMLGMQTALRGLLANQAAIDTTGHNIANANTPGYSRQRADMVASSSMTIQAYANTTGGGVQIGTGVDVSTISRIRNQFLDVQYRAQNSDANSASTTADTLDQVQAGLAEPSTYGLSSQLNDFWKSWSALNSAPTSQAARTAVVNDGQAVATTLNSLDQQLQTVQAQSQQQITTLTAPGGQLDSDAKQIVALNKAIGMAQSAGESPNDLMDQRDQVIDDLSSLGKVSVTDPGNGMLNISFGDMALPLVSGASPANSQQSFTSATGGKLGGLVSLSDPTTGTIAGYRKALDTVKTGLAGEVNALQTAPPFFSIDAVSGNISVSATPSQVQTSDAAGNDVTLKLADLGSTGQATQGYASFVAQVGGDVKAIRSTQQTSQAVLSAVDSQRQSASGVSLDEEMTNLITYQRGYEASAKMMTTISSMLDTLINHTF